MSQHIIIKEPLRTKEELYNEVVGQKVSLIYFTGNFSYNTGHGYTGIGKHSLVFPLQLQKTQREG